MNTTDKIVRSTRLFDIVVLRVVLVSAGGGVIVVVVVFVSSEGMGVVTVVASGGVGVVMVVSVSGEGVVVVSMSCVGLVIIVSGGQFVKLLPCWNVTSAMCTQSALVKGTNIRFSVVRVSSQ